MNTIDETIKMSGFGKKKVMKKQIDMFESKLNARGEKLIAVCASVKGKEQLYVTDQRIVLHEIRGIVSNHETSIPLQSISSINISTKLVYSKIEIVSTGNTAKIEGVPVHIANEIKIIIDNLKSNFGKEKASNTSSVDLTDDLRGLKDLLDEGILTQGEFDAKKKQLLGI